MKLATTFVDEREEAQCWRPLCVTSGVGPSRHDLVVRVLLAFQPVKSVSLCLKEGMDTADGFENVDDVAFHLLSKAVEVCVYVWQYQRHMTDLVPV
jgi:hypothetical protein